LEMQIPDILSSQKFLLDGAGLGHALELLWHLHISQKSSLTQAFHDDSTLLQHTLWHWSDLELANLLIGSHDCLCLLSCN
jgi:hypothetical protein